MQYYLNTHLSNLSFDQAKERVTTELAKEGFGIITEIDVKATMKKKLDVDFKNYTILGACNPKFAYEALTLEDKIGVLLPCNVLVIEQPDGRIEVAAIDPAASMSAIESDALTETMNVVTEKLQGVINKLS